MGILAAIRHVRVSRLQVKLLAIVGAALAIAAAVALAALTHVYGTTKEVERIARESHESQIGIVRTEVAFRDEVKAWQNLVMRGSDPGMREIYWTAFREAENSVRDSTADARAATRDGRVARALDGFAAAHAEAGEAYRRAFAAGVQGGWNIDAVDKAGGGLDRGPSDRIEEAEALAQQQGAQLVNAAVTSGRRAYEIAMGGILATMLAALVGLAFYTRRTVLAPIAAAASHAERIALGDLTARTQATSRDEAGQLLATFARMTEGLGQVVTQVRDAADAVVTASGEVDAGMADLSQRTEEQASSLEETAASMEQLSGTVRQNADNAREADELASTASKRAEQGGREVARVVVTMSEISASAKRIADILSVIDGIAFQTNILALNAAVEAARAGEQGRGFAVVAAEVRSLAQRSAQAAKEIKDLIGTSVSQVEGGTRLVDQAGGTIAALVGDVKKVSGLMRSIAEASAEQSRGVQQVSRTVTEMDKVVQQNASAVQRSASAAEGMRRQAAALLRAVGAFRVREAPSEGAREAPIGQDVPAKIAPARSMDTRAAPIAPAAPVATAVSASDDWEEF